MDNWLAISTWSVYNITHNSRVNYNWTLRLRHNGEGVSNYRHQSGEESAGQAGPWRHWRRSGASAEGTDPYTTDSPVIACGDKCRHFLVYCVSYNKFHATCKIICRTTSHRNVKKIELCKNPIYQIKRRKKLIFYLFKSAESSKFW